MAKPVADPYEGNILIAGLGPILSPGEILQAHTCLPPLPPSIGEIPVHVRMHFLMQILDLHIPPLSERQLSETTGLILRQGYRYRDPNLTSTWSLVGGQGLRFGKRPPGAFAACVAGIPGVGKSRACQNSLACYRPLIHHEYFPGLQGGNTQVTWQSVELPPGGRASDLARALMRTWDATTGGDRFKIWLAKDKMRDSMGALDEWLQVAIAHFLGLLHLDEIQNLFKIPTLKKRTSRKGAFELPELSIVEDRALRWILHLTNTAQIPLLVSGTPDGIGALSKRLGTLQRINTFGYHEFTPIVFIPGQDPPGGPLMGTLTRYQYVKDPMKFDDEAVRHVIYLAAGVQRYLMALWIAAHRVAFDRGKDALSIEDFNQAAITWLAPLLPAIEAIRSGDPLKMAGYHDLVPLESAFWRSFWKQVAAT